MSAQQLGMDGSAVPAESIKPPPPSDDDGLLDAVVALWKKADDYESEAVEFEDEARNARMLGEDTLDDAHDLIEQLVRVHPEWKGPLENGYDPRVRSWD